MRFEGPKGSSSITVIDDPSYVLPGGSATGGAQPRELDLAGGYKPSSIYVVTCALGEGDTASIAISVAAGATRVHDESVVMMGDRCIVGVGDQLVCLAIPSLDVRWHQRGDAYTVFGVYLVSDEQAVIVHGEGQLSRWTTEGVQVWHFGGRDILTGGVTVSADVIVVQDFNDEEYCIDPRTGRML